MSLIVGVAFILWWLLVLIFKLEATTAALVTGMVFVLLGIVGGDRILTRK